MVLHKSSTLKVVLPVVWCCAHCFFLGFLCFFLYHLLSFSFSACASHSCCTSCRVQAAHIFILFTQTWLSYWPLSLLLSISLPLRSEQVVCMDILHLWCCWVTSFTCTDFNFGFSHVAGLAALLLWVACLVVVLGAAGCFKSVIYCFMTASVGLYGM